MKTIYWILIIAAILVLIYGYNKGWFNKTTAPAPQDVLDSNGVPVNSTSKVKACEPECLIPYPPGSQYYGSYYCDKNCAVFKREQPVTQPIYVVTPRPFYPPFHPHH